MQTVSTIGLDIAKSVFQLHGVDASGVVVIRRQLKRPYVLAFFEKLAPCLVGIEACASSHYWSREGRKRNRGNPIGGINSRLWFGNADRSNSTKWTCVQKRGAAEDAQRAPADTQGREHAQDGRQAYRT